MSNKNYGDYTLPFHGAIYYRNLQFPTSNINSKHDYVSLKPIINPRQCKPAKFGNSNNKYGQLWYPQMYIDKNYNPNNGGYINANGPLGPYFAQGLMNTPRSMYVKQYFGQPSKSKSKSKKSKK